MAISLLHTPEGVRDLYNEECAKKETVSAKIGAVFHRFGYRSIQTPSYEFFDIFNKDRGSVASNQMFKFFDRDGNTLVLRPDITPSIARCAAKYFMDEDMPVRLCYNGNIFINNMSLRGSLKESTVMGAEMINDTTTDADAEMVAMLIQSLQVSGLTEFQVEIGQVDFFNGLVEEAGFNEQETDELELDIDIPEVDLFPMWGPGYAIPSEEGNEATSMLMKNEGIVIDTCYTGKAFAGLINRAREGFFKPEDKVLFIHTGGAGGLFSQDWEHMSL